MSLEYRMEFAHTSVEVPRSYTNEEDKVIWKTIGYVPIEYEHLKNDYKFQMLISKTDKFRSYKIRRYRRTKEIMDLIIPMIDRQFKS